MVLNYSSAESAEFWFDDAVLNVQIPSADKMTFNLYESKCIAELERLKMNKSVPSLVQRVARLSGAASRCNA